MSRITKAESDLAQIAAINSVPPQEEEAIPEVNISGVPKDAAGQIAAAPNYLKGETSKLDGLDELFLAQLKGAISKFQSKVDLSKFDIRSLKELVGYPGGGYVNWTMVFTHQTSRKVLRSDPLVAGRGGYAVIINELDSISR